MKRNVAVGDEVSRLWRKHQHARFPARLRGEKLSGVDLVALEAAVVGCVERWRSGDGTLDEDQCQELTRQVEDLDVVVPLLTSRVEALYFERLTQLALVVLDS